jgi:competence protein ComEA
MWTDRQRGTLIAVVAAFLLVLAIRYWRNPTHVPNPLPAYPSGAPELMTRVDPNRADFATLAALPVIGPAMAQRIIDDREAFLRDHPGQTPYSKLEDLDRIPGVGPATLKTLELYLAFPGEELLTTRPASVR